jgi:hypothetical protein
MNFNILHFRTYLCSWSILTNNLVVYSMAVRLMAHVVAAIVFLVFVLQAAQVASPLKTENPSNELHPVFGNLSSQVICRMLLQ